VTNFERDEILPPDPDLEVLHDREYRVRAFRKDPNLLIRGAVRDQKPPGLYLSDDPDPLTIHHMQVDLEVSFPAMEIVAATVVFESHPHELCPSITPHYEKLVGLSIARGFTHKVRELFGGPRGCTHTTALLQAMAPVAIQCVWSMALSDSGRRVENGASQPSIDQRRALWATNLNTCHEWAEDGELVTALRNGGTVPAPLPIRRRAADLGIDIDEFFKKARG